MSEQKLYLSYLFPVSINSSSDVNETTLVFDTRGTLKELAESLLSSKSSVL